MENMKIVDFNSGIKDGQMNTVASFYPEDMGKDERIKTMQHNKQRVVEKFGLSYKNIFIPIQKNTKNPDKYEDGKCYTLTSEDVSSYSDLYDYDVYADIVKLTKDTPNIAIAFPAADCAVVKAVNFKTGEIVLSHCGGEYIDRYLPMQTIDALGGNEKDIKVYVSPFAYSLFYSDATKLTWANNSKVWDSCKEYNETDGLTSVRIDIYKALRKQLLDRKIEEENISFSGYDLANSGLFYSHHKASNDKRYAGRNLFGIALVDNSKEINENAYIKVIK